MERTQTLSTTIAIDAPVERVAQVMCDVERWHEWTPSITRITRLGNGPFVVGSRALVRQPRLPPATWTVTAIDPNRGFTWENRSPGSRIIGRHYAEPAGTGSRATLSIEYAGPFARLVAWMTRSLTLRYVDMEAAGLKRRSEDPQLTLG